MQALRHAFVVVNSKWKLPIIVALRAGTRHFRGLECSVAGISTKLLAKELKELEAHQLIVRTVRVPRPARGGGLPRAAVRALAQPRH